MATVPAASRQVFLSCDLAPPAPAIADAPVTTEAARWTCIQIQGASEHLRLAAAKRGIARLIDVLADSEDSGSGQPGGQRDVTVLSYLPGVGQTVLATLLTEARQALAAPGLLLLGVRRGDRHTAIRQVQAHRAPHVHPRPPSRRNSAAGRGSRSQRDPVSKAKYAAVRGNLHHAPNPDLLPAPAPGGGSCGLISCPCAGQPGGPHPRTRHGPPRRPRSNGGLRGHGPPPASAGDARSVATGSMLACVP